MRFIPEIGQVFSRFKRPPTQEATPTHSPGPEDDPTGNFNQEKYRLWYTELKESWQKNGTIARQQVEHINSSLKENKFDSGGLALIAIYLQRDLTLDDLRPTPEPQKGKTNEYKRFGELKTSGQLEAEKLGQDYINQVTTRAQEIATILALSVLRTGEVLEESTLTKYLQIVQDAAKAIGQLYREKNPPDEFDIRTKIPTFSNQLDLIKSQAEK